MWTYHPDLLARPVPRYTSFPTAAEFGPLGDGAVDADALHRAALAAIEGPASLYVHIPYCEQICWYCGCNTQATGGKPERLARYLDTLAREIALVAPLVPPGTQFGHVAFGGGSPNAMAPMDFVRLVQALTLRFGILSATWSIETDPRSLGREWAQVIAGVGVTRASLGVQTFAPRLQQAIGRVQPDELIARATDLLRGAGVTSLNFDLMYGLPGQDIADLQQSLQRTVELGADRIALFGYAHVPHLIARQRKIDATALPDQAERFRQAEFGHRYLVGEGYVPVGFDHFARPGDPLAEAALGGRLHRNFQGFTEDPARHLVGLGASSISCFPGLLVQNGKATPDWRRAIEAGRLPGAHGKVRDRTDVRNGALIAALLCAGTAPLPADTPAATLAALEPFVARGLATLADGQLTIAPDGLPYARTIAALFDPYRQDVSRRFSSAV